MTTLRSRTSGFAIALAAAAGLALAVGHRPALAQSTPPRFVSGTYDSWYRKTDGSNLLVQTPRSVQLKVLKSGALMMTSYVNNKLQGSQILVPTCEIRYDWQLTHWYRTFETSPADPKVPRERVKFAFRINQFGDYDVYYPQPGGQTLSEILVKQEHP